MSRVNKYAKNILSIINGMQKFTVQIDGFTKTMDIYICEAEIDLIKCNAVAILEQGQHNE